MDTRDMYYVRLSEVKKIKPGSSEDIKITDILDGSQDISGDWLDKVIHSKTRSRKPQEKEEPHSERAI